jgi:hypothetical protein
MAGRETYAFLAARTGRFVSCYMDNWAKETIDLGTRGVCSV